MVPALIRLQSKRLDTNTHENNERIPFRFFKCVFYFPLARSVFIRPLSISAGILISVHRLWKIVCKYKRPKITSAYLFWHLNVFYFPLVQFLFQLEYDVCARCKYKRTKNESVYLFSISNLFLICPRGTWCLWNDFNLNFLSKLNLSIKAISKDLIHTQTDEKKHMHTFLTPQLRWPNFYLLSFIYFWFQSQFDTRLYEMVDANGQIHTTENEKHQYTFRVFQCVCFSTWRWNLFQAF